MMNQYSRRQFLLRGTSTLGASLFLKACSNRSQTSLNPTSQPNGNIASPEANSGLASIRFILDWAVQGTHAPLAVGIEKGYFAEEGLNVTFSRGTGSADSISKVAADAFDIGFGDINSMVEFNAENPSRQVRAVAIYYNKSPMSIMSLQETGISTPKLLEGKRLGIPAGSATRKLLPLFAKTVGFDASKVELPAIDSKLQQTLLITKEIDAIAPFTTSALPNLKAEGYGSERLNVFQFVDYGLDLYGNAIIAPAAFLAEKPDQMRAFLRAFTKAFQDTLRDPDGAIAMTAKYDSLFDKALERERLQIAIDTLFINSEVAENGFGMVEPKRFETTIAQVVEGFGLATAPKSADIFDGSFLPERSSRSLT